MRHEVLRQIKGDVFEFNGERHPAPGSKDGDLYRFDSLSEFIELMERTKTKACDTVTRSGQFLNHLTTTTPSVSTGATYEEAREMALHGWKDGLSAGREIAEDIEDKLHGKKIDPLREYSVAGGCPDIPVALANDPECFMSRRCEPMFGRGRIARLRIHAGMDWDIPAKAMTIRGLCLIGAIDALERNGISTEIDVIYSAYLQRGGLASIEVPLKSSNTICDDDRLAFCIGHPAFCRRYMMRAFQVLCSAHDFYPWLDFLPEPNDIHFPPLKMFRDTTGARWRNDEMVIDYHLGMIEKNFSVL